MSPIFFGAVEARSRHPFPMLTVAAATSLAGRVPAGACRFLLAGGLSSLLNWLVRFPLSAALPYGAAVGIAYAIGMVAGFLLYRNWVFPGSPLSLRAQIGRFILVNVVGLTSVVIGSQGLVALITGMGIVALPVAEAVGHGMAIVLGALVNFGGHRVLTFARSSEGPRVAAEGVPR